MDNKSISKILQKGAKLLELHEGNPFKIRSYQNAAFNIDKLPYPLAEKNEEELAAIDGIGKNLVTKIIDIVATGAYKELNELLEKTPDGIVELLDVKGVGPKKIRMLWKEYDINNKKELLKAAEEGKLEKWKGFGAKTQQSILENLLYEKENMGKVFFAYAEKLGAELKELLSDVSEQIEITGQTARMSEIVEELSFVVLGDREKLENKLSALEEFEYHEENSGPRSIRGIWKENDLKISVLLSEEKKFGNTVLYQSADSEHLNFINDNGEKLLDLIKKGEFNNTDNLYEAFGSKSIPPELREGMIEWDIAKNGSFDNLIKDSDLKGTLHNHSTYSDGKNSLEEMAQEAKNLGYEYLGISDHSKSAFYANGLDEDRILQQHDEIDALNEKMAPFKIFKGIESDILNDGALDYADDVLASFDFIVSSIHSGLSMNEKKATARLLKAIENPYTTMLGHPTGRLLLRRQGYPINHKMIIDACADNNVIIEINSNPWRLDLSWEWVAYALEKGVVLSLNPDAHELKGYYDMHYGVCMGRKGGLTPAMTFNAKSVNEVDEYFQKRKSK